jgi:hypothetical protein
MFMIQYLDYKKMFMNHGYENQTFLLRRSAVFDWSESSKEFKLTSENPEI